MVMFFRNVEVGMRLRYGNIMMMIMIDDYSVGWFIDFGYLLLFL